MEKYPSMQSARRVGRTFSEALEDEDIPGAGCAVYAALSVLGKPLEEGIAHASYAWQSTCQGCYVNRYDEGVKEAKALESRFRELRANWS
jgi:hypothetical protein